MSGQWQVTGTTSLAAITPPTGSGAAASALAASIGTVVRIRALSVSAGAGALTITDSVLSAVIWQITLGAGAVFSQTDLDIRGSPGASLTIAATSATGINAQGDYVPIGYPYGLT